jgi:uncharacterized protein YgiM (DUF1202 family)
VADGLDIDGDTGDKVVAVADGYVKYADYSSTAGNFIEVLHANGIMTRYMHFSELSVKTGDNVKQGQQIGLIGSTGRSTGSHLHFEVRTGASKTDIGTAVDPVPYLKGTSTISDVFEVNAKSGQTGSTTTDVNLRSEHKIGNNIIKVLPKNTSLTVASKIGEWYKITAESSTGYVYYKYVNLDGDAGGSSTLTRRQQIILAAKNQAAKFPGVDYKFLLAIGKHETQLGDAGAGCEPLNAVLGYDVNGQDGHPLPCYQGFDNQMYYGAKRVHDALKSHSYIVNGQDDVTYFHNGGDMGKAYTWSQDASNWISNVWSIYQDIKAHPSDWDVADDVGGETINSTFGSVKGNAVNVRKEATVSAQSLGVFNMGHVFEYYGKITNDEGDWYKVKVSATQEGYIDAKYFEPNTATLTTDYILDVIFEDDFENYTMLTPPEQNFSVSRYQGDRKSVV